jgi:hypothetical protein
MQDLKVDIGKLRRDAAECKLVSDFATDKAKRDLFDRLGEHLAVLANEVERAMITPKNAG